MTFSLIRPEFNATYKSTKKQYDLLLSRTKKDYFNSFIRNSDNKSKASWRVINSLTTGKMSSSVSNSHDNSSLMPDDFNNFFIDYPSILTQGLSKSPSEERDRLDLSKAFDCVEHGRLLEILEDCGIRDNQLKLMESYLSSRKQMVAMEVDGEVLTSEEREVTIGVPQGSIPGPILFIVYINRLPKAKVSARHSMGMFADDTNYRLKSSNISTAIEDSNNVLKSVGDWFRNHNLILNIDKTQCMFFYSERSELHHPLSINISDCFVSKEHLPGEQRRLIWRMVNEYDSKGGFK
ncbi:uncharacterized protein LOC123686210 [Harmonia axyridis]|uniref:uncharacterized protein LOC123686210 n=1 Tax=Harmonia axyridis TaxID=115357 RepID=UPI001E279D63|nr:uncharacterized protein LOC123686210 [Harmonia axyridis]